MSAASDQFIGIDVGTSSLKAVVIEASLDSVAVIREVTEPYTEGGLPVRSLELWVRCARMALSKLKVASPRGLGITGQMHALIALAADRSVLPPTLLWLDMQGEKALADFVGRFFPGGLLQRTANIPLPDFTLAKWLYATASDPSLAEKTFALLSAKDYLRLALDPGSRVATDSSEATGTQLYNPFLGVWDTEILGAAGIPERALPEVATPSSIVGSCGAVVKAWKDGYIGRRRR
ncbi:MAG: FGGY family carbohydrate kinase [Rectinemataceae bacterium]